MNSNILIIVLAFVAQACAQDSTIDKLIDNLFDRALKAWHLDYNDLESSTLEKAASHLARTKSSPHTLPAALGPKVASLAKSSAWRPSLGIGPRLLPFGRTNALGHSNPGLRRFLPRFAASASDGIVKSTEGPLTKLTLTSGSGATAEIFTLGATVTSFKAPSEVLFVRPDAKFDGSKPISGGLPFCWPQFGPGDIQQHGFARNCDWTVAEQKGGTSPSVTLELTPSEYTKKMWDYDFKNKYVVTVSDDNKLKTTFEVTNTGSKPFTFTGALHSYFNVGDIGQTAVQGAFKGATIFDRMLDPPARTTEERPEVTVAEETDRCYEGVAGMVKIADKANSRTIVVDNKAGYVDTCVWNPWNEGMGSKNFICVESGNVKDKVTVEPGKTWTGEMTLSLE